MKTFKEILLNSRAKVLMLLIIFTIGITYNPLFAEEPKKDAAPNSAMKGVFAEVKKDLKQDETMSSFLMIAGVIAVVGIAVYLSFRSPSKKETKQPQTASHTHHHAHPHPAGAHHRRR